jgi:hypothetical protein
MREITTEVDIAAPAEVVWRVLTDFAAFEEWNPFMLQAEGELVPGQRISVTMRPPGHGASTFRPRLLAVEPARLLRWRGQLLVPGLFDGEHVHELTPLEGEGTRYVQREEFGGILVPFTGGMLRDTERGFAAMNAALRQRAERLATGARVKPSLSEQAV